MNVTVENLNACKKLIRFELESKAVDDAFESVTTDFSKKASLPGFRPGKAPKEIVAKQYTDQIKDEIRRKLISESYHEALKEKKINALGQPDIEEIQFERGLSFLFAATVETAPEFELPDYRGLPAKRENGKVTDADIDKALVALREQKAEFDPVERALAEGDVAVINYSGTCDGKPLTDIAPTARGLTRKENFWVAIHKDSFIPGFTDGLVGASKGDKRTVEVDFPEDFVSEPLSGMHGVYEVEIVEVRERRLPEADDELAKQFNADTLEDLRVGIRQDLQNEINTRQRRTIRNGLVQSLLEKVQFELPESFVSHETRNIVYDIVNENQKRGVETDAIDKSKDEIYAAANKTAKERVKLGFLVHRIAEVEGIRTDENELQSRIATLSQRYNMTPDKFLKELKQRDGIREIYQQIIHEKVIDFLHEHAKVEDVEPGQLQAAVAQETAAATAPAESEEPKPAEETPEKPPTESK